MGATDTQTVMGGMVHSKLEQGWPVQMSMYEGELSEVEAIGIDCGYREGKRKLLMWHWAIWKDLRRQ